MKILHKKITISGRVQGVGFRHTCYLTAKTLGICGYVKNLSNGNVYIEAEGSESKLRLFIKWCSKGPDYSHVEEINIEEGLLKGFDIFMVKS